jgi:hypothetical protein
MLLSALAEIIHIDVEVCTAANHGADQLIEFWFGRESAQRRTCAPCVSSVSSDSAIYARIFTAIDNIWLLGHYI